MPAAAGRGAAHPPSHLRQPVFTVTDSPPAPPPTASPPPASTVTGRARPDGRAVLKSFTETRRVMPSLLVSTLFLNLLGLALPLALLQVYNRIVPNQAYSTLTMLVVGVALAMVLDGLLRTARSLVTGWLGVRFEHRVSCTALAHIMGMPLREYVREEAGGYRERLRGAGRVRDFYSGEALTSLLDLPFMVLFLGTVAAIGGWLVLVPLTVIGVFLITTRYLITRLRAELKDRTVRDDRRYNFLAETLRGVHSIKTMAMEAMMHRRYERLQESNAERGTSLTRANGLAANLGSLFTQVMTVGVAAAGAFLVIDGRMTPGALAACVMLSTRSLQPLRASFRTWLKYQSHVIARDRLTHLFDRPSAAGGDQAPVPGQFDGALELINVRLRPPKRETDLFHNLNLKVAPGECVAIQGESGSGKSSLLSLLNGTIAPDSGEVLVDGQPVSTLDPEAVQQQIAYLPQEGVLVKGTIMENLTMHDPALEERALEAARKVGLDRVVAGFRLGYETPVGEGSTETMPAGIRQRIAVARALAHDPVVLLFDEANHALDSAGDRVLTDYLESVKGRCTIILVTHRPSLRRIADRQLVLRDGALHDPDPAPQKPAGPKPDSGEDALVQAARPVATRQDVADLLDVFPQASDFGMCLAALLRSMQWRGTPRALITALPHVAETLDLAGLRAVMDNLEFSCHLWETSLGAIDNRLMPCLFLADDASAQVVLGRQEGRTVLFNGETVSVGLAEDERVRGTAYLFRPREDHEALRADEQGSWSRRLIGRFRPLLLLLLVVTVLSTALALVPPLFIMAVFTVVAPTGDIGTEGALLVGVVMALGLDFFLRQLKSGLMAQVAGRLEYILGSSIFERILGLPAPSIERVSVGSQISRIKDLESLRDFFLGPMSFLMFEVPATLVFAVVLLLLAPPVLLVVAGGMLAFVVLGLITYGPQDRVSRHATRLAAERDEFLTETLKGLFTIRAAGAAGRWLTRYRELSGRAAMAEYRATRVSTVVGSIAQLLGMFMGVGAMVVTAHLVIQGELAGGAILAIMIIIWRMVGPVQNAFLSAPTFVRTLNSLRQVDKLMRLKPENEHRSRASARPTSQGAITLSRVSFRYTPEADPALLAVSLDVNPGELIAIAGPNGSGKSTILKLLLRTYMPQAGGIRLDGVDIRQLTVTDVRDQITYMPQRCEIFYGTIAQNLRLVHPTASDAELRWATDMANLTADIEALPEGFQTRISDTAGEQLALGFRQRLSLARTLLKPAAIVLLDEPGNGLDWEGEQALTRALQWLRGRATTLVVTHRPGHMRIADRVIYMEGGQVRAAAPFTDIESLIMSGL